MTRVASAGRANGKYRREERPDHARDRIIEVAVELTPARGFAATYTRATSERLGFAKAKLSHHFRTKDDLLAAVIRQVQESLAELIGRGDSVTAPRDRHRIVSCYVDLVASNSELSKVP